MDVKRHPAPNRLRFGLGFDMLLNHAGSYEQRLISNVLTRSQVVIRCHPLWIGGTTVC